MLCCVQEKRKALFCFYTHAEVFERRDTVCGIRFKMLQPQKGGRADGTTGVGTCWQELERGEVQGVSVCLETSIVNKQMKVILHCRD